MTRLHTTLVAAGALAISAVIINGRAVAGISEDSTTPDRSAAGGAASEPAEVVVTAQRRQERLTDVGMTVTAIDSELLAQRQIDSPADLTQVVSALSIAEKSASITTRRRCPTAR
jgi:iron complex outermembrane receptor protein